MLHITIFYPSHWLLYLLHSPIPFCPLTSNMLQPPTSPTWLKKPALEPPSRNVLPPHHHNHVSQQCSFQQHPLPLPTFGRLPSIPTFLTPTSRKSRHAFWSAVIRNSHPYQLSQCPYCFSTWKRDWTFQKQRKNHTHSLQCGAKRCWHCHHNVKNSSGQSMHPKTRQKTIISWKKAMGIWVSLEWI